MLVKQESGGLLLLRRTTPLTRRNAVYFCSGAYRPQIRLDVAVANLYIGAIRLHADVIVEICSV